MDRLTAMQVFVEVAERGRLLTPGDALDISRAASANEYGADRGQCGLPGSIRVMSGYQCQLCAADEGSIARHPRMNLHESLEAP